MKFKYGMWFVAVLGSILLGSAGAWAQTQQTRWQTNLIAAGVGHTCELRTYGTVRCWGKNGQGQLGDGSHKDSLTPVSVIGLGNVVAIAAGRNYTCALRTNGKVSCWGENDHGQLGDGTKIERTTPVGVDLPADARAVAIAAGEYHACALMANGTVRCWGWDLDGQLGNGVSRNWEGDISSTPIPLVTDFPTPVKVKDLTNAVAIAAGGKHTCALRVNGTAKCWGFNFYGQLGNGDLFFGSSVPVAVKNLSGAVAITAGGNHTCALLSDGTAKCWGSDNSSGSSFGATPVTILSDAVAISAGGDHTCARLANGAAKCWGDNSYGQLGNGNEASSDTPVVVQGLSDAEAISAGGYHSCALQADGTTRCWGRNHTGQLGDGTKNDASTPTEVVGGDGLRGRLSIDVAAGTNHSCTVLGDGTAKCWGQNNYGQLGNPNAASTSASAVVVENYGSVLNRVKAIAAGGYHTCAVLADGTVKCWGNNEYGQLGNPLNFISSSDQPVFVGVYSVKAIAAGTNHTCALKANGTVMCWGQNNYGQLGDGNSGQGLFSATPVTVSGLSGAAAITASGDHTCARLANGTAKCWGNDFYGQLGDGTLGFSTYSSTPVTVKGVNGAGVISGLVTIAAGESHTCAVVADGTARCWGWNQYGQLGAQAPYSLHYNSWPWPIAVSDLGGAVAISAGMLHTCAALADGTAKCWGLNILGQLGANSVVSQSTTPLSVFSLNNVAGIAAGGYDSCARQADGTVWCWGDNTYGQLGVGTYGFLYIRPVQVKLYP